MSTEEISGMCAILLRRKNKIQVGEWYMYGIDTEKLWRRFGLMNPFERIHKKILSLLTDDDAGVLFICQQ